MRFDLGRRPQAVTDRIDSAHLGHALGNAGQSSLSGAMSDVVSNSKNTTVFVSYSRKDLAFVDRFGGALEQLGYGVSVDRKDILPLEDWAERLRRLIELSDTIVFVISPDSIRSVHCKDEVQFAASLNKRIAPVIYRNVPPDEIPPELARLQFISFEDVEGFDDAIRRLDAALTMDIVWIRRHTQYLQAARLWDESGRGRGGLLEKDRLRDALKWLSSRPLNAPPPTELIDALIEQSRVARRRAENVRAVFLGCVFVLAVGLAAYALVQRSRAETSFASVRSTADGVIIDLVKDLRDHTGVTQEAILLFLPKIEELMKNLRKIGYSDISLDVSEARLDDQFAQTYYIYNSVQMAKTYEDRSIALMSHLLEQTSDPRERYVGLIQRIESRRQQAEVYRVLGDFTTSLAIFDGELVDCGSLINEYPDRAEPWLRLIDALGRVADIERTTGAFEKAEIDYEDVAELIAAKRSEFGDPDPFDEQMSWILNRLGDNRLKVLNHESVRMVRDDGAAAADDPVLRDDYRRSTEIRKRLMDKDDKNAKRKRNYVWSLALYGMSLIPYDRHEADAKLHEALAAADELIAGDAKNAERPRYKALILNFLGDLAFLEGRSGEAFRHYADGLALRQDLYRLDPKNAVRGRDAFYTLRRLSQMAGVAGDAAQSEAFRRQAVTVARDVMKDLTDDRQLAAAYAQLDPNRE